MNVSKKILALLMAMLMAFSCIAISASATDTADEGAEEDTVTVVDLTDKLEEPELYLDVDLRTITVTNYTKKPVYVEEGEDGASYDLDVTISPADGVMTSYDEDDCFLFSQLSYGTEYTVTVSVIDPDTEDDVEVKGSVSASVELLSKQTSPAAPVPVEITASTITISAVSGCEYKVSLASDGSVVYDWDSTTKNVIQYTELEAETKYVVSARKPATDTYYESDATSITVTTKKAAETGTPVLSLADKTNTSITVAVDTDRTVEYSLDAKTWQKSNVFSGLTADTQYTIYARYTFDAATQDPSAVSAALVVKTNAKANYEANEKKLVFSAENGQYANSEIEFAVNGDGPSNMNEAIYGDTRIIPVSYTVVFGSTEIKAETAWETVKLTQAGSFTAPGYEEKVVTVKVTFVKEEYKGSNWEYVSETTKSYDITIGRTGDTGTKVLEFFEGILNFLLNTVPAFFAEALKSDVWARLFEAIGNIGKVMG